MKKLLLTLTGSLAILQSAQATVVFAPDDVVTGLNGIAGVNEYGLGDYFDPVTEIAYGSTVGYEPTITSGQVIAAFVVSHNDEFTTSETSRSGWSSKNYSASLWDSYTRASSISIASGNSFASRSLGSFASLFGTDTYATLYFLETGTNTLTESNNGDRSGDGYLDFQFRRYNGSFATEFIALDTNGAIIDRSIAAVPEPSSTALLSLGTLGLLIRRKR